MYLFDSIQHIEIVVSLELHPHGIVPIGENDFSSPCGALFLWDTNPPGLS